MNEQRLKLVKKYFTKVIRILRFMSKIWGGLLCETPCIPN